MYHDVCWSRSYSMSQMLTFPHYHESFWLIISIAIDEVLLNVSDVSTRVEPAVAVQ